MEESPELISPRISFSHDLPTVATPPTVPNRRSDTSLMSRLPEPEFDFPNAAAAADVAPADRLFTGGVLLPMPPLPPAPTPNNQPCRNQHPTTASIPTNRKPPACQQKRPPPPGSSWASPFSRSNSVNSATTRSTPRSSSGRFGCPSFPLMRSRSAGSAAVAQDVVGSVSSDGGAGRRPQHKKFGASRNGGSSRVYYYGGGKKGGSSHGVRVSPVINVPFIGAGVVNVLSYLLCDCSSSKTAKSRGF